MRGFLRLATLNRQLEFGNGRLLLNASRYTTFHPVTPATPNLKQDGTPNVRALSPLRTYLIEHRNTKANPYSRRLPNHAANGRNIPGENRSVQV